jgi:hypothetical protein
MEKSPVAISSGGLRVVQSAHGRAPERGLLVDRVNGKPLNQRRKKNDLPTQVLLSQQ